MMDTKPHNFRTISNIDMYGSTGGGSSGNTRVVFSGGPGGCCCNIMWLMIYNIKTWISYKVLSNKNIKRL